MNDIMADLETFGNSSNAAIASIGAVHCNIVTGEIYSEFYRVVELKGQTDLGLTITPSTLYWWLEQSDAAREGINIEGRIKLTDAISKFKHWLENLQKAGELEHRVPPDNLRLWGNGATFDNVILVNAFEACEITFPLKFWNHRDMRTLVGFYPRQLAEEWNRKNLRVGTHHNALDDAKHQVKYCSHILQELGVQEIY